MQNDPSQAILVVDDDEGLRRVLEFQLEEAGYRVLTAGNGKDALAVIEAESLECVITDWRMPEMTGGDLLAHIGAAYSHLPVIVITAYSDVETAVSAMRRGAFDFITKPFNREMILIAVERALKYGKLLAENRRLRRVVHDSFGLDNVIGSSRAMQDVFTLAERVSRTDATVLVEGESGTGKELIAKGIHLAGARREGPFVALNCAAIPETLIEAELFGYKKGAFTGATSETRGKFEVASGGTIFLDEIGAMPLIAQPRLLRVLQEQEVTRLGENTPRRVDVRVIAATHENLREEIESGGFREDLFYRLNVVPLPIPPLRERREDIPLLIEHFLAKSSQRHSMQLRRIDPRAARVLYEYHWPGNVRELENTVERMVVLSSSEVLRVEDVPAAIRTPLSGVGAAGGFSLPSTPIDLEELERGLIKQALTRFSGNQSQAARHLGITRSALIYRMQKFGLG